MARVIRSPRAKRDIIEVLHYTRERWGKAQALEYGDLIKGALAAIAGNPHVGKPRNAARALRLLHDSMDFGRHLS